MDGYSLLRDHCPEVIAAINGQVSEDRVDSILESAEKKVQKLCQEAIDLLRAKRSQVPRMGKVLSPFGWDLD